MLHILLCNGTMNYHSDLNSGSLSIRSSRATVSGLQLCFLSVLTMGGQLVDHYLMCYLELSLVDIFACIQNESSNEICSNIRDILITL